MLSRGGKGLLGSLAEMRRNWSEKGWVMNWSDRMCGKTSKSDNQMASPFKEARKQEV
jgi:hypothetical protein